MSLYSLENRKQCTHLNGSDFPTLQLNERPRETEICSRAYLLRSPQRYQEGVEYRSLSPEEVSEGKIVR